MYQATNTKDQNIDKIVNSPFQREEELLQSRGQTDMRKKKNTKHHIAK